MANEEKTNTEEKITINQKVYQFIIEGTKKKPELHENSKIHVVLNGKITDLELHQLFWGTGVYGEPEIDFSDADIKGYSLLQFMDITENIVAIDAKHGYGISFYDMLTEQHFKIGAIRNATVQWFDKTYGIEDKEKFAGLLKNATPLKKEEIIEEQKAAIQAAPPEEEREPTYAEHRDKMVEEDGFTEYKSGRIRFLYHPEEAEAIIRLNDEEEIEFEDLMEYDTKSEYDEEDKQNGVYFFIDKGVAYNLTFNGKSIKITDADEDDKKEKQRLAAIETKRLESEEKRLEEEKKKPKQETNSDKPVALSEPTEPAKTKVPEEVVTPVGETAETTGK